MSGVAVQRDADRFHRILFARSSPQNGCLGPAGARLVPATDRDQPSPLRLGEGDHFFVAVGGREPNAFGWVGSLEAPLNARDLQKLDRASLYARIGSEAELALPPIEWYMQYLRKVSATPPGTAMSCYWREVRGPGVRRRELSVHRVVFYDAGEPLDR